MFTRMLVPMSSIMSSDAGAQVLNPLMPLPAQPMVVVHNLTQALQLTQKLSLAQTLALMEKLFWIQPFNLLKPQLSLPLSPRSIFSEQIQKLTLQTNLLNEAFRDSQFGPFHKYAIN